MLEKPNIQDEKIFASLLDEYGLSGAQITFLPLGADRNSAVYRVVTYDEALYFLKLRWGAFERIAVQLPGFLNDQGIRQIIAPLATKTGQLWADLDTFKLIVYPFVDGHNGYEEDLSDRHWVEFGRALKSIHTAVVPSTLLRGIPQETYSPQWRERLKAFMEAVETGEWRDSVAIKLAAFLKVKRHEILDLVKRTEQLALTLQVRSQKLVVCHSDIHAGNILIDIKGALYIVDWDNPILAPKERDLMFSGGGQFGTKRTPQEEDNLFYHGYGQTSIDLDAIAYYRYERIIEDIAIYCEQLLLTNEGGEDREQSFQYLISNFLHNGTIEVAYNSDRTLRW